MLCYVVNTGNKLHRRLTHVFLYRCELVLEQFYRLHATGQEVL